MSKNSSFNSSVLLVWVLAVFITIGILASLQQNNFFRPNSKKTEIAAVSLPLPNERTYSDVLALPQPKLSGGKSVEAAIQERRSRRAFSDEPVTLSELSQLLWSAQGITDTETGHRAAPSARGAYPFTVFVVVRNVDDLTPGLYEYLPAQHALGDMKVVNAGELLSGAGVQPGAQEAPVVFVLSAAYGKAQKTLGESAQTSTLLEAGHIGQNMYLQTESLGMSMVVMGGFDSQKVGSALSLDPAETVVYLMPFGNSAPESEEVAMVLGNSVDTTKNFTAEELAQYDGKEGRKAYAAYEGKVYDFSASDKWKDGEHYGLSAGKDLTGQLGEAPHGGEVVEGFPVVGTFGQTPAMTETPTQDSTMLYVVGGIAAVVIIAVVIALSQRKTGKKK